jgi:hypothetical protein
MVFISAQIIEGMPPDHFPGLVENSKKGHAIKIAWPF